MVGSLWWNMVQQFFGQIAMRINNANSMAESNVLNDEIAEEGRLAGTSFSDDINMLPLINGRYAKRLWITPPFTLSDDNVWFVIQNQPPLLKIPVHKIFRA